MTDMEMGPDDPNNGSVATPTPSVPSSQDECRICFESFDTATWVKHTLACGHSFCVDCIDGWARAQSAPYTCPLCRRQYIPPRASRVTPIPDPAIAPIREPASETIALCLLYARYTFWIVQVALSLVAFAFTLTYICLATDRINDDCGPLGRWDQAVPQCNVTIRPKQCKDPNDWTGDALCTPGAMASYQRKGGFQRVLWMINTSIAWNLVAICYWGQPMIWAFRDNLCGRALEYRQKGYVVGCAIGIAILAILSFLLFGIAIWIGKMTNNEIDYEPNLVRLALAWCLQALNGYMTLIMQWLIHAPYLS